MGESKRTVTLTIPQTVVGSVIVLLVGGGGGGIAAPWMVSDQIAELGEDVQRGTIEMAETRVEIAFMRGEMAEIKQELREMRRRGRASHATGVSTGASNGHEATAVDPWVPGAGPGG